MAESWTINNAASLLGFHNMVDKLYAEHKYITYSPPRIGPDRSQNQNALLHVWLAEYAGHLLDRPKKEVAKDKGIIEGMKLDAKKLFVIQNPLHKGWMVYTVSGPLSGSEKKAYTSSADWKRGEAYVFLTWLQLLAANDGLILESKGEFAKLQRIENGL